MATEEATASMANDPPAPDRQATAPQERLTTAATSIDNHTQDGLQREEEIMLEKNSRMVTPRSSSSLYSFVVGKQSPLDNYDTWSDAASGGTGTPSEDDDGDEEPNWALNAQHQQQIEQFLRIQLRNQRIIVGLTLVISVVFVVVILYQSGRQYGVRTVSPPKGPFNPNNHGGTSTIINMPPPDPLQVFVQSLSNETQQSLLEAHSPSNRALEWISTLGVEKLESWRIPQLFALTTLYFTLDGPHWPYNFVQWMLRNPTATTEEWYAHQQPFCASYCRDVDMNNTHMPLPEGWHVIRRTLQAKSPHEARLTSLDLTGLDFSWTTTDDSVRIPPEPFLWTSLQELKMGGSLNARLLQKASLVSLLPLATSFSGRLSSLSIINGCGQEGVIPTQLGLWTILSKLHLEGNHLRGTIPLELSRLTLLRELSLDHNSLRGTLPREFGLELNNLRSFRANDNGLIGGVPTEYFGMFGLQLLDLSNNHLSGSLPAKMRSKMRRSQLKVLQLQNNSLTGQIPSDLLLSRRLEQLDLSHNNLQGQIPTQIGMLPSATHINLSHNRLEGSLPSELGSLAVATSHSDFDGQPWRGREDTDKVRIPTTTRSSSNIVELDFSFNNLTGTVPTELFILVELGLKVLNLTGNPGLTGTVPDQLCQLALPNCTQVSESPNPGRCFLGLDCIPGQICGCSDCPCTPTNTVVANTPSQFSDGTEVADNISSTGSNSTTNDFNGTSLSDDEENSDQNLYAEMTPNQSQEGNVFAPPAIP